MGALQGDGTVRLVGQRFHPPYSSLTGANHTHLPYTCIIQVRADLDRKDKTCPKPALCSFQPAGCQEPLKDHAKQEPRAKQDHSPFTSATKRQILLSSGTPESEFGCVQTQH